MQAPMEHKQCIKFHIEDQQQMHRVEQCIEIHIINHETNNQQTHIELHNAFDKHNQSAMNHKQWHSTRTKKRDT